jgi:hypothetical protein
MSGLCHQEYAWLSGWCCSSYYTCTCLGSVQFAAGPHVVKCTVTLDLSRPSRGAGSSGRGHKGQVKQLGSTWLYVMLFMAAQVDDTPTTSSASEANVLCAVTCCMYVAKAASPRRLQTSGPRRAVARVPLGARLPIAADSTNTRVVVCGWKGPAAGAQQGDPGTPRVSGGGKWECMQAVGCDAWVI